MNLARKPSLNYNHINLKCSKKIAKTFDRNKIMLQKVAGVYIQASRIQTTGTKKLKGLKIIPSNYPC